MLHGQRIDGKKPFEINRLGLSRSFQISNIFPKLSVFENLRCAVLWSLGYRYAFWRFLSRLQDSNERAEQLMEMIALHRKRDTLAINLTYAEQRALEIGITIAGGASVILLDEPTAGMSKSETGRFIYEHCLPFDVTRAHDEASGIRDPRIWTAERDQQMWHALQQA